METSLFRICFTLNNSSWGTSLSDCVDASSNSSNMSFERVAQFRMLSLDVHVVRSNAKYRIDDPVSPRCCTYCDARRGGLRHTV